MQCHALREGLEAACAAAGAGPAPVAAGLPWFDLLPHPAA